MKSYDDDTNSSEAPPSYDEAISEPSTGSYSRPIPAPPHPPRPVDVRPPQPPRPSGSSQLNQSTTGHLASSRPPRNSDTSSLYTSNSNLPFQFPKGFLCQKCRNSGYKVKNGKICRDCWNRFYLRDNAYNPNPNLPFKYPKRYLCDKCYNSGRKMKNGLSCKDCWEMFSPRNNYQPVSSMQSFNPFSFTSTFNIRPVGPYGPGPTPPSSLPPMRVNPGDPRMGGSLCGRCRGSGLVTFFLDDELCPVCNGIGRIFGGQPMQPPLGPGQPGPPPGPQYPPNHHPGYSASNNYMGGKR